MARRIKKTLDVQSFGGSEHITDVVGNVTENPIEGVVGHSVESTEAASETKLEQDVGIGRPIIMRNFQFKLNKEAFGLHVPTKQELFDGHVKGIEVSLWRDGLIFAKEYEPHILFNKAQTHYTIIVFATNSHTQVFNDKTQTLTEILNG